MNKNDHAADKNLPENFRNFKKQISVRSPGRINLIGEHTDYNNGFVLPTAIDKYIDLHFAANSEEFICNIYSRTYGKSFSIDLRKISRSEEQWENYILGVINEIQKRGKQLKGFDCIIESDLPVGAGISSSAALECGLAFGLNELFSLGLSRQIIAELSRDAEHNYVGTKCGIMDQYASVLSRTESLILLDCQSLEASYVPAEFTGHKLLLLNTMVSHSLAESEYNTRRKECEEAVDVINKKYPEIRSLRDVSLKVLQDCEENLPELLFRRAHYVILENQRVLQTVEALKKGDLHEVGKLMYASHHGLKNDYEVSCRELDFLVDLSTQYDHVKGARMMGGGFGGCTINLIEEDRMEEFIFRAAEAYKKEFDIALRAIPVFPEEGSRILT